MPLKPASFSRYRPRLLTLVVFFVVAALLALANLSCEREPHGPFTCQSYGWPLVWHRYVMLGHSYFDTATVGWYYSASRLAANLLIWILTVAALAGFCEWLLRRYRPPLRWSLRTMLASIAFVATSCAWFAAARERANLQDSLVDTVPVGWSARNSLMLKQWGPKWLQVVGLQRYFQQMVCAVIVDSMLLTTQKLHPKEENAETYAVLIHALVQTAGDRPKIQLPPQVAEAIGA